MIREFTCIEDDETVTYRIIRENRVSNIVGYFMIVPIYILGLGLMIGSLFLASIGYTITGVLCIAIGAMMEYSYMSRYQGVEEITIQHEGIRVYKKGLFIPFTTFYQSRFINSPHIRDKRVSSLVEYFRFFYSYGVVGFNYRKLLIKIATGITREEGTAIIASIESKILGSATYKSQ